MPNSTSTPGPHGTRLVAAGHDWDAIKMGRHLGLAVLERLKNAAGSVVVAPKERAFYFLVPVGTAATWRLPPTTALGEATYVILPRPMTEGPPGPYWLPALVDARVVLTSARALRTAVTSALAVVQSADTWLASASADPGIVRRRWAERELAALPAGTHWDVVELDLNLSTVVMGLLQESGNLHGPLLASGAVNRAWWLIPPGAGAQFTALADVTVRAEGWMLEAPQPGRYAGERTWLIPPDADEPDRLTEPGDLLAAIEATVPDWKKRHSRS